MPDEDDQPRHPIQVVAARTGLSPDVLRSWERRYEAVRPCRSGVRRRMYSDREIERLRLLRRATEGGRRIGDIAHLSPAELDALVREDSVALARPEIRSEPAAVAAATHRARCLEAAVRLDAAGLECLLARAAVDLDLDSLLDGVVGPMLEEIGERWLRGVLSIAHEHMATARVRSLLDSLRIAFADPVASRVLIATTPRGQFHEIGALEVSVVAAVDGWRSVYLGPDLPAAEIVAAARELGARAVALSIVWPDPERAVAAELEAVATGLPDATALLVGGRAAAEHGPLLARLGARLPAGLPGLRAELARLAPGGAAGARGA